MFNNKNDHNIHKFFHLSIAAVLLIWVSLSLTPVTKANTPKALPMTMGSLCGKLVFLTEEKTGATRLGLRSCTNADMIYVFSQNPADLYNVYQFKNVEIESGEVFESAEYGKLKQYITGWDNYFQIASCSDCNKGIPVLPTATITPTEEIIITETQPPVIVDTPTLTSTPFNVSLAITNFEADPGNPVLKQRFLLRLTVENKGDQLQEPTWGYTGQVTLKDSNGGEVEAHSFSNTRFSYMTQAIEDGQPVMNKWVVSIPVSFSYEVEKGRLSVSLKPNDYPISPGVVEALVTLKPAVSDNRSCALAVAGEMGQVFADNPGLKTAWDGDTAAVVAGNCGVEDVGCFAVPLIKKMVKTLLSGYPDIQQNASTNLTPIMSKIIGGLAGTFDVNVLQVCRQPDQWLTGMVKELNRQKLPVNLLRIHSPAVMKISNAQGGITGLLVNGEIVEQIPDSRTIQWNYEEYILYPPQEVLVTVQGIADGTLTLEGVLGKGSERVNVFYENITAADGFSAVLNTADASGDMQIDANGDGQIDITFHITRIETIPQENIQIEQTPDSTASETKQPYKLPCINAPAIALPLLGIWLLRRKNCR